MNASTTDPAASPAREGRFLRVPLAWKNLTHSPRRLTASVAGVTFAVLVMFVQIGFLNGLFDSATAPIGRLRGEVVIMSRLRNTLIVPERFSRRRLQQAASVEGVAEVRPLYMQGRVPWRDPNSAKIVHPLRVFAVDPRRPALLPGGIDDEAALAAALRLRGTVLYDVYSKFKYFDVPEQRSTAELAGRAVTVSGLIRLGTDFANDGNVVVSDRTFAWIFPNLAGPGGPPGVDLGVVRVAEGHTAEEVRDRLRAALPPDEIRVLTREELGAAERRFWFRSTPVGFIFGMGTVVGFLVGVIICYQILYSEVTDHTAEFATIKAMGYGPAFFARVILAEAVWLSVFGFSAGLAIAAVLYEVLSWQTGLQMTLTLDRAAAVGGLTLLMCVASGLFTVRKVFSLDPADLF